MYDMCGYHLTASTTSKGCRAVRYLCTRTKCTPYHVFSGSEPSRWTSREEAGTVVVEWAGGAHTLSVTFCILGVLYVD